MEKTRKKKILVGLLCGVLVLAIGTGVAMASGTFEKSLTKVEDGVVSTSYDDGATWTQGVPDGMEITETEDGGTLVTMGEPPADGADTGDSLMSKMVDGTMQYSTDGGQTWSEDVPDGVTVEEGEDGKITSFRAQSAQS